MMYGIFALFVLIVVTPHGNPTGESKGAKSTAVKKPASTKAWLGIGFVDLSPQQIPSIYKHAMPLGAVQIQQVFPNTSASQANLEAGDVILAVNKKPLNGRTTLLQEIGSKAVGEIVELKIGRANKILTQKMGLTPKPEDMQSITQLLVGSRAPELNGNFISKNSSPFGNLKGKPVILDFWATWCGPCLMTIPTLENLYEKYKSKGLTVIGISSEPLATLQQFFVQNPPTYPQFHDIARISQNKYSAYAYPTLVYINREGVIHTIEAGAADKNHIENRILEILN